MTEFEKIIYNTFLETSKKVNNKPVRYRKDFTKAVPPFKYLLMSSKVLIFKILLKI